MNIYLVVTEELCSGCGNCVVACPINSLSSLEIRSGKGGAAKVFQCIDGKLLLKDIKPCNGCGVCLKSCPNHALSIVSVEMEKGWKVIVQPSIN